MGIISVSTYALGNLVDDNLVNTVGGVWRQIQSTDRSLFLEEIDNSLGFVYKID